jgi:hypothetical protein
VERTTIAGETEELGENLPQRHFAPPQIPHDQVRFRNSDRSGGKPATNRLSYGAALSKEVALLYRLYSHNLLDTKLIGLFCEGCACQNMNSHIIHTFIE